MTELGSQIALFEWASLRQAQIPELRWLYAVPNGGFRHKKTAMDLKRSGVKAGVPDVVLPVPHGKYHGLYIEMKFGANRPTKEQTVWHKALSLFGYAVAVCYSTEYAIDVLEHYLEIPQAQRTQHMAHVAYEPRVAVARTSWHSGPGSEYE